MRLKLTKVRVQSKVDPPHAEYRSPAGGTGLPEPVDV